MNIILHIGTHKTGTTSLQHFLAQNRKILHKRGLYYPSYTLVDFPDHTAHHELANALAGDPKAHMSIDDTKGFIEACEQEVTRNDTVFFSAESLFRQVKKKCKLDYWGAKEEFIREAAHLFRRHEVKIMVVLRRQSDYAESIYQENIKKTDYSGSFKEFVTRFAPRFDYNRHLNIWQKHFKEVNAFVYEDLQTDKGLIPNFLKILGVCADDCTWPGRLNESLHPDIIEFKRRFNAVNKDSRLQTRVRVVLASEACRSVFPRPNRPCTKSTFSDQSSLAAAHATGNENVRRKFTTLTRKTLFPEQEPNNAAPYKPFQGIPFENIVDFVKKKIPELRNTDLHRLAGTPPVERQLVANNRKEM